MVTFKDLPDAARFMIVEPHSGAQVWIKTMEDGGEHNAVAAHNSHWGVHVPDECQVVQIINADPFIECCNTIAAYESSYIQR